MIKRIGRSGNFFPLLRSRPLERVLSIRPIFAARNPTMIQRKQTLFLLLGALCGVLTFFFPVDTFLRGGEIFIFRTDGIFHDGMPVVDASSKVPFSLVIGFLSAMLVAAIFFYRKRPRQLMLVRSTVLVLLGIQVFLFITDQSLFAYLGKSGDVQRSFGLSLFLPVGMIVFALLAMRGISADERLVKSMDRLR